MRLILPVDLDEKEVLDFCVIDLCNKAYRKKLKERLTLYLKLIQKHRDLCSMTYDDSGQPILFYAGAQKINKLPKVCVIPAMLSHKSKNIDNLPEEVRVYEVDDCSIELTLTYRMVEIECIIAEEGLSYRAFHANGGGMVFTAPVQLEVIAKRLGINTS